MWPLFTRSTLAAWLRLAFLFGLSLVLVGACQTSNPRHPGSTPFTLRVGVDNWPGYYPLAIAEAKGYFAQEQLRIELTRAAGTLYMAAFNNQQLDVIFAPLGNAVVLAGQRNASQVVAMVDESQGADAIVADADIRQVADLRGKRLGVKVAQFGELFVRQMLETHGVSSQDVHLIDLDGSDIPNSFSRNIIQAGHTWEPFVTTIKATGRHVLFSTRETPGLISDVIVMQDGLLKDHPNVAQAFLRAWFQAAAYWLDHPAEGNAIIAKAYDLQAKDLSLDGIKLSTVADNQRAFAPGDTTQSLAYTIQLYSEFFRQNGTLSMPVESAQLLNAFHLPPAS
jgi:NitT/TauT family transport system substrate-binding protein